MTHDPNEDMQSGHANKKPVEGAQERETTL